MAKDAKPDAWMPIYIGDYHKDTGRLTTEQHGAYLLMIMEYWTTGPLVDDDDEMAAIIRAGNRDWKRLRPKLARFFTIADGVWRHKRVDAELERWAAKRAAAIERARKGGAAKAASSRKNPASSTPQALLKGCSSSSAAYAEGPNSPSALSGKVSFLGPEEVRSAFVASFGEDWTAAYLDPCQWVDVPGPGVIPVTGTARQKLKRDGRALLAQLGVTVLDAEGKAA